MKLRITYTIILLLACMAASAQSSRLVGYWRNVLSKDSAIIKYNPGNRAVGDNRDLDSFRLKYDTLYAYTEDNGVWVQGNGTQWQHINAAGYIDTAWVLGIAAPGSPLEYSWRNIFAYDSKGRYTDKWEERWNKTSTAWSISEHIVYTYDGDDLQEMQVARLLANGWSNDIRKRYTYQAGLPDSIIEYQWQNSAWVHTASVYYHYNSAGNVDTIGNYDVVNSRIRNKTVFMYDAGNKVETTCTFSTISGNFIQTDSVVFRYRTDGRPDTIYNYSLLSQPHHTMRPGVYTVFAYSGGTGVRVDTMVKMGWNDANQLYVPTVREIWSYNTGNQLVQYLVDGYHEPSSTWQYMNEIRYYYEDVTTGVKPLGKFSAWFSLYPNPAADVLMLLFKQTDMTPCIFSIHDAMGRLQRTWQPQHGQQVHTIPVSDLQPGIYTLTLSNGVERQSQQFVVAR
ncbi:MAG TPA: T9SS type A sorting domain-containing protein [Flavipsychrobacter sp.]